MSNSIKITDIKKTKKGFNALFSNDKFLFSVDDIVLYKNNIQIGSCFSQQELDCVSKQSQSGKAVDKCYTLLSYRMHSKKELYDKLCKNFDSETSNYAVNKMQELGLIDDLQFAQMKAEYLLNVKKYSVSAIKMKLMSLGIDKYTIDSVLLNFKLDNQIDDIVKLLQTKYSKKLSQPQKVIASLIRKGFRYGEIKSAMNILEIDLQEY